MIRKPKTFYPMRYIMKLRVNHLFITLLSTAFLLTACGAKDVKLKTNADKASYGVGLNIGRQLSMEDVELNADAIAQGIRDGLSKAETKLTDEEIREAMEKIREEQVAKQKEKEQAAAKEGQEFLDKNAKKEGVKTLESGLQYEVISESKGETAKPKADDVVKVHYHGTLVDGTVFDSSVERGTPAEFKVSGVIAGWVEALQLMEVGDKWKLYIPAELAYGSRSPSPKIPANSALIFDVELLEIKDKEPAQETEKK